MGALLPHAAPEPRAAGLVTEKEKVLAAVSLPSMVTLPRGEKGTGPTGKREHHPCQI